MTNRLTQTAPPIIYLQVSDDKSDLEEIDFPTHAMNYEVTWCQDSAVNAEVKYVRADLVEAPKGVTLGQWMDPERGPIPVSSDMAAGDMWTVLEWALAELEHARTKP